MTVIDLNADLGEGFGRWELGNDDALLDVVTSANVACGFHAGDPSRLRRVVERASDRGVVVGAQVSYPDLVGFGRRFVDVDPADLRNDVLYQAGALAGVATGAGPGPRYLKPHGALYHACSTHPEQGTAVLDAARLLDLPVLCGAATPFCAAAGDRAVPEAFVDRAYDADGRLLDRRRPGAVITDPGLVRDRAVQLAVDGTVTTADGATRQLAARSLCLHGDTPGASTLAASVREALEGAGVTVRAFLDAPSA